MHDVLSMLALLLTLASAVSMFLFQGITGVAHRSSNSVEAADVVTLLRQSG